MSESLERLVRDLKGFEDRKVVLAALRKNIRRPVPAVRKAIRARALDTLPSRGGLNAWAASVRITVAIRTAGRAAGVRLKGGRNSAGGRSDIKALDRGRVRHPSWGRRGAGQWHNQTVPAGFITKPVTESTEWRQACIDAVDEAVAVIGRG
jgi:hypothetical protein